MLARHVVIAIGRRHRTTQVAILRRTERSHWGRTTLEEIMNSERSGVEKEAAVWVS